ncbi:hypothetical protein [Endozoicomonas sp. ISHI1]|uniref:hypothetical protein n=1 Tax=Endozoicomonas sp. ISHI1 TaxID=2825882 RepID=UPI002148C3AB|nr:hypothetical protein [Endozoicomonas sp. ISHI1]
MIDQKCSRHFYFKDLICCGETFEQERPENMPQQDGTWTAIKLLATSILDPVQDHFGRIHLTYGLSTPSLTSAIRKRARKNDKTPNIYPPVDQHAGYELNCKGMPICPDLGLACDFICTDQPSDVVAEWVIQNCDFDKLYFYGANRPLHVSIGPKNRKAVTIVRRVNRKVMPKNIAPDKFREFCRWVEVP